MNDPCSNKELIIFRDTILNLVYRAKNHWTINCECDKRMYLNSVQDSLRYMCFVMCKYIFRLHVPEKCFRGENKLSNTFNKIGSQQRQIRNNKTATKITTEIE